MRSLSTSLFALGTLLSLGLAACKKDDTTERPLVFTTVSTLAGAGTNGYTDGAASTAQFSAPEGLAADAQGNVYVADYGNGRIRKITPAGTVSTLAGNGNAGLTDGPGASASFKGPADVALDNQNNIYVADFENNCVRKITPAGVVSTLAGTATAGFVNGSATAARFDRPYGLAVDAQGNVYVADYGNACIRKITPSGVVSTLAGTGALGYADGPGSSAQFVGPKALALDAQGNLYVADFAGERIRKVTPAGVVSTLAGTGKFGYTDGPGSSAQFSGVSGLALDAQGNLYVADTGNNCIRKVTPGGVVSTLAGTTKAGGADGPVATAQFNLPSDIAAGSQGVLYVTELSERIRKITTQ
ncbi:MAG TPA: NHL repeat-containing protein [Hymenobacter sp.]|uniref:NHL repeat-containing protein n=1 Tax=Hymenobacter sp. TaxID=1898978 RepID=UPI002D8030C8|nr:NHL repeat-containing protein [Hymenobacter sp.]HET9505291.1 NHL repeat-containing protein [Hymenobacter sp.]